jgi:glyoxylase-like metal-dependent hydrolase (beta-lactamase superfamily II)
MRVVRETDHLYRLTRIAMVNNFLVKENDGTGTLVDTGLPGSASAILRAARQAGVPIDRILLTHERSDAHRSGDR